MEENPGGFWGSGKDLFPTLRVKKGVTVWVFILELFFNSMHAYSAFFLTCGGQEGRKS